MAALLRRIAAGLVGRTTEDMDWLIAGLGNPGPRYAETRHNIGKRAVQAFADRLLIPLDEIKFDARHGKGRIGDQRICIATTLVQMNVSGRAIVPLANFYKLPHERLLIVYDDMDLPLGQLRVRQQGGAGGHKGMRSVIQHLGSQAFPRLRIGVGRPPEGWAGADHVLGRFREEDQIAVDAALAEAVGAMVSLLGDGLPHAMNTYNRLR